MTLEQTIKRERIRKRAEAKLRKVRLNIFNYQDEGREAKAEKLIESLHKRISDNAKGSVPSWIYKDGSR